MMRARRGFSLLEAIVGVAIATAFVGAIAVFASNLGDTRARLGRSAAELETADAVFAEVERACATAVVDDARLGAGIAGNESSLSLVRCAVGLGEGRDELLSDRSMVRVEFDGARGRIALARGSLRDELPAPVRAMRVRYLADDGWVDAFDSAEHGAFPALLEVSIWFERGEASAAEAPQPPAEVEGDAAPAEETRADRVRVFRIAGAPRIDPLAIRRLREERGP
ncbi:MAG: hypothetical protein LW636_00305 [Planctomycetaceae bacterium]|jgi:hypothetical protein|nr:hypothetical protein [Planctomycetaceae bacterium]